jgi:hypothetical protein
MLHWLLFSVQDLKTKGLTGEEIVWPVCNLAFRKSERDSEHLQGLEGKFETKPWMGCKGDIHKYF